MKKYIKIKSLAVVFLLVFSFTTNSYADYNEVMAKVEEEFDNSENKLCVLVKKIDLFNLQKPKSSLENEDIYTFSPNEPCNLSVLAVAIERGDVKRVQKFLGAVEDPNDPSLFILGTKKSYNMVTLVSDLNLWFGFNFQIYLPCQTRLAILDLLAESNFNFNFIAEDDPEKTLPLVATIVPNDAHYLDESKELRARLLLQGADPILAEIEEEDLDDLVKRAFEQVREEKLQGKIKPTDYVKELLENRKQELFKEINALQF